MVLCDLYTQLYLVFGLTFILNINSSACRLQQNAIGGIQKTIISTTSPLLSKTCWLFLPAATNYAKFPCNYFFGIQLILHIQFNFKLCVLISKSKSIVAHFLRSILLYIRFALPSVESYKLAWLHYNFMIDMHVKIDAKDSKKDCQFHFSFFKITYFSDKHE